MLTWLADLLGGIPIAAVVAVLVVAAVQVGVQVYALVDLARRKTVTGDRKWVWALLIVGAQLLGAVAYLALGRPPPPEEDTAPRAGGSGERDRAIDRLYGERDRQ